MPPRLEFQPPTFVRPQQYPDFAETITGGIQGLFESYQRLQTSEVARAQAESAKGAGLLQFGFDPGEVARRPELLGQARAPAKEGESELIAGVRNFLARRSEQQALEVEKTQAEILKVRGEGEKSKTTQETLLRSQLQNLSKPFFEVRDAYGRVEAAAKNPSAAGDLALIFNYMKILDPGSTVREGEFATAQNAGSLPQRITAMYNRVISGERLPQALREDFVTRAGDLYGSQLSIQKRQETAYKDLAQRLGASPENVVLDLGLPAAPVSRQALPIPATRAQPAGQAPRVGLERMGRPPGYNRPVPLVSDDGGRTWRPK